MDPKNNEAGVVGTLNRRHWLRAAGSLAAATAAVAGSGCALLAPGAEGDAAESAADAAGHSAPAPVVLPFSAAAPGAVPLGWRPYVLRRDLPRTRYATTDLGDRRVLHARARRSATGLHCAVDIDPLQHRHLDFSWKVRAVERQADVAAAERDDCPARLIVAFDGDHQRLSLRDRLLFDQVELFTGQRLPFAMIMYVWDGGSHAPESVHRNHRTARIQYLTVESGHDRAGQWLHYRRDVVADFRRVYGETPGRIIGVGVLTDADALKLDLEAWYGDIALRA